MASVSNSISELLVLKEKFERLAEGPVLFRQVVMECPESWDTVSPMEIPLPSDFAMCSQISKSIWVPGQPQLHFGWKYCDIIGSEIRDLHSKTSVGTLEEIGRRLAKETETAEATFWDLYQRCCAMMQNRSDTIWHGVSRLLGSRRITAEILHRLRPRRLWYFHPQHHPSAHGLPRWVPAPPEIVHEQQCRVWLIDNFAADTAVTLQLLSMEANKPMDNSLTNTATQLSQQIRSLPDQIVASFASTSPTERVRQINGVTSEIVTNAFPIITWIERNRPNAADLEKQRLFHLEDAAKKCAAADIPEYAAGVVQPQTTTAGMSAGVRSVAELSVFCLMFSKAILGWANEFEREMGQVQTTADGPWSEPDSPKQWAKRFNMSWDTLKRRIDEGKIRVKKLTSKSYQIHVDDLPRENKSA